MSLSLVQRALLAVVLMVGFYTLAIGIALGLLYIPYALVVYGDRFNLQVTLFCLGGAGVILWSILPRRDHFTPPGPRLTQGEHPRLFHELTEIARVVSQDMPVEVYLVPEVNAWVAQRGGVMGFGSRRVMGLGLPLLQLLTVSQLRAVLAHEFGHFQGGDTKLAPWVYKTRSAIGRTLQELEARESLLIAPFELYGKMFLRVTQAISRRQEVAADELAAKTAGGQALVDGLLAIHQGAAAYPAYWGNRVAPTLEAGLLPPIMDGFGLFFRSPSVVKEVAERTEAELKSGESDPYDTHPTLRERIAFLDRVQGKKGSQTDAPTIELLNNVPEIELRLLVFLYGEDQAKALKAVDWEEAGTKVLAGMWKHAMQLHGALLKGMTVGSIPDYIKELRAIGKQIPDPPGRLLTREERDQQAAGLLGVALSMVLAENGWKIQGVPGEFYLHRSGVNLDPHSIVEQLVSGELKADAWRSECDRLGIAELGLENRD
jgi:Zn-dependent protease with chaperone function